MESVNEAQKKILAGKVMHRFGSDLRGRHFAVWGLAFKPDTDDMREAPSRTLIKTLLEKGATVAAYDPVALGEARRTITGDLADIRGAGTRLSFVTDKMEAASNADALIVVTEWKEFKSPDFNRLLDSLRNPVIFDGRNLYEPESMDELGLEYHGIGRSSAGVRSPIGCIKERQ